MWLANSLEEIVNKPGAGLFGVLARERRYRIHCYNSLAASSWPADSEGEGGM